MASPVLPSPRLAVTTQNFAHAPSAHIRSWCVVHACDTPAEVFPLVDGQLSVGMKPYLLSPTAAGPEAYLQAATAQRAHPGSLLTVWNEVREWRKRLTAPELVAFELIHAHEFPAGMAAVRNCPAVVYDLHQFIEARDNPGPGHEFTWLARSFRVAEQFVITRAGAVVVHAHAEREGVLERGALEQNVFQIPDPLHADWVELMRQRRSWAREGGHADTVAFFAPDVCLRAQDGPDLPAEAVYLLEAFALINSEVAGARLFVQADAACVEALLEKATALGTANSVHAITSEDRERVLGEADVIIATPGERAEVTVLTGLLKRCAVLAADAPPARDASSDGRGVLWFRAGDVRDLAYRATFLARNPDFRVGLAEAGRKHLLETRSPEAVARRYDAVYRHAWERRRTGSSSAGMNLQPLTACL